MEDRKEIQKKVIKLIEERIEKDGEDGVFTHSAQPGKNTWSNKEVLKSVIEDRPLENTNDNIIDMFINYQNYKKEMKLK